MTHDALALFHCEVSTYEFDVTTETFDLASFYKATGLGVNDKRWSTVFNARSQRTGYHVHFKGSVSGKAVNLSLQFYGRSVTRPRSEGPFAETAMQWLGSFFKKPRELAWMRTQFAKPNEGWRSRFNLPFRVSMSGSQAEVVIDGISLELPKNDFGAVRGWLNKYTKELGVSVLLRRGVDFSRFKITDEIVAHNDAIRMFIEETTGRL